MSHGIIVQIIGAVIDVEFPRDAVPQVYDALLVEESGLTLEVQQQMGDGVVRTIAMGSSDGLKRGIKVSNSGKPVSVPVGKETLGHACRVQAGNGTVNFRDGTACTIDRKVPEARSGWVQR